MNETTTQTDSTPNRWATPVDVNDAQMAFPASVVGKFLPPRDEIPDDFHGRGNEWTKLASRWFFEGLPGSPQFREDIDPTLALRQLKTCLGSFEPKHEHKEAGVGYLLSLWCVSPTIPEGSHA